MFPAVRIPTKSFKILVKYRKIRLQSVENSFLGPENISQFWSDFSEYFIDSSNKRPDFEPNSAWFLEFPLTDFMILVVNQRYRKMTLISMALLTYRKKGPADSLSSDNITPS